MRRHEVAPGVPRQRLGHVGRRGREDVVANDTRRNFVGDRVPHAPRQRDLGRRIMEMKRSCTSGARSRTASSSGPRVCL